jgi:hypothetical protein
MRHATGPQNIAVRGSTIPAPVIGPTCPLFQIETAPSGVTNATDWPSGEIPILSGPTVTPSSTTGGAPVVQV